MIKFCLHHKPKSVNTEAEHQIPNEVTLPIESLAKGIKKII